MFDSISGSQNAARALAIAILIAASAVVFAADDNGAEARFEPDVGPDQAVAIFAGGCFWCVEEAFDKIDGVQSTTSGFTGGHVENPGYKQVTGGTTGHAEAVKVVYDPSQVDYGTLLDTFWHNIDPTDDGGQFCDRGSSYRAEVFYVDDEQQQLARASKQALQNDETAPSPIVTQITPATTFYAAEASHQDYHRKNPTRYAFYKNACRREQTLDKRWGPQAGTAG